MSPVRAAIGLLGVGAVGLAVAAILSPSLVAGVDASAIAGDDYRFVVPVGAVAAAAVVAALFRRPFRGVQQATTPDPEGVPTADLPGAAFDRLVEGGFWTAPAAFRRRYRIHDRLRTAAIRAVARDERTSRAEAQRTLVVGDWTDDPVAARFLAGADGGGWPRPSVGITALLAAETPFQRRARRTAEAIVHTSRGGST